MLSFGLLVATILPLVTLLLLRLRVSLALRTVRGGRRTIAFLHPYCNDGGGGERVLWVAIRELLARAVIDPARWRIVVYTGDPVSDDEIRAHALRRFGVAVPEQVEFVRLAGRGWIEPKRYPVATLLGQAFGSLVLAAEAIARVPPDVLVDTTGLHFCLPLLRAAGVPRLACYVHYPLISSDMLGAVASRKAAHNNASLFARFQATAALKLAYYHVLVFLYRCAGRMSDCTVANGSWTAAHVRSLWGVEVGLHTMWNEHFGIGIVEMLAAGVVPVAHNSGGPALDIIEDRRTGRLATTEKEYADAMEELLLTPGAEPRRRAMAAAGRASVATRFSEAAFAEAMVEALRPVLA